jgi:dolichol-phosphate mannosyltransferase
MLDFTPHLRRSRRGRGVATPFGVRPLVIVPTYNERRNLPTLVAGLLEIPNARVLVVDDGSPDGTGALADELAAQSDGRISVLHRTGPKGLGRAYLDGIEQALRTDADVICQMDADLSHRPRDLVAMLEAAKDADLVIGSRYVPGGQIVNWPRRRRLLSAGANRYVRWICSMAVRDCTSGFRCWKRETLSALPLHRIDAEGYAFLVQLLWEAVRAGCAISEVPITFVEREFGASKLRLPILVESAVLPWRLVLTRVPVTAYAAGASRNPSSAVR